MGRFPAYVVTMLALDLFGLSLVAGLLPGGTTLQTYGLGATLLFAPLLAYWLVYREGFERLSLGRLLGRGSEGDGKSE